MLRSDDYLKQHPEAHALYDDLVQIADLASVPSWLAGNHAFVQSTLIEALPHQPLFDTLVTAIMEVLVVVMPDSTHAEWFRAVAVASLAIPYPANNLFRNFFRSALLRLSELVGEQGAVATAAPAELQNLLEAYIQLIEVFNYNHNVRIPDALLTQMCQKGLIARNHGMNRLYAALNRQCSHYYLNQGDFRYAEHYAKLALSEYGYVEDDSGSADASYTLALTYREDPTLSQQGDQYLQRARLLAQSDHLTGRDYSLFYEEGVRAYVQDLFGLALSYLDDALAGFEKLNLPHHIAMTNTMLAMTYIYMGRFADAEAKIALALAGWEALENEFELVNLHFVAADLELQRGSRDVGLKLLMETQSMAEKLPKNELRQQLITRIERHRDRFNRS